MEGIQDHYSKETVVQVQKLTEGIRQEMASIQRSFETVAFNLFWIYKHDGYKTYGYLTIADYAQKEFGIKKTTCYDFINIAERFGKQEEKGEISGLDDKWKAYGTSKLALIADLSDEEIETLDITPDMPAREIKKAVSTLDKPEKPKDDGTLPTEAEIKAFYKRDCKDYIESGRYSRQTLKDDLKEQKGKMHHSMFGGSGVLKSYRCYLRGISINDREEITWNKLVKLIDRYIPVDDFDDPDLDDEPETAAEPETADEPETTAEPETVAEPEPKCIRETVLTIPSDGDDGKFEFYSNLLGAKFIRYIRKYLDDGFEIDITAYKHS